MRALETWVEFTIEHREVSLVAFSGAGLRVDGLEVTVCGLQFRLQGSGFRIDGGVEDLGFRLCGVARLANNCVCV